MKITDQSFVFVVCGAAEHIDTLNFSLEQLKKRTGKSIIVVTDLLRNAKAIEHDQIISIATPSEYDHHQASIFLKTSLHKILATQNSYCYFDTDVICLSTRVDMIFEQYVPPVTFAPDHFNIKKFSPSAINCNCNDKEQERIAMEEREISDKLEQYSIRGASLQKEKDLVARLERLKERKISYWLLSLKFNLSGRFFKLGKDFIYDKELKYWFDAEGRPIHYDSEEAFPKVLEHHAGIIWEEKEGRWNKKDDNIYESKGCNHLVAELENVFHITVKDVNWTHWNGGVFLFNDMSHEFMESWHQKTLRIFNNKRWKTRDQGTLAGTVWEFQLQNHPTLNKQYNFLADYNNVYMQISDDEKFISDNSGKSWYQPILIHIYHHFGDRDWYVWNWVEKKLQTQESSVNVSSK